MKFIMVSFTMVAVFCFVMAIASCGLQTFDPDQPNPLDEPGEGQPTVEDLHRKNMRSITNNPAYF